MPEINNKPLRFLLQAINYSVFMALIWYFATSPSIQVIGDDEALITIAFSHAGQLREPCHRLSQEELSKLAPNMRKLEDCPRERSPVIIEASLDGETFYQQSLLPPGIFNDGGVNIYFSSRVPVGQHRFEVKMDDSVRDQGINHTLQQEIDLETAQILLVSFSSDKGFVIQ